MKHCQCGPPEDCEWEVHCPWRTRRERVDKVFMRHTLERSQDAESDVQNLCQALRDLYLPSSEEHIDVLVLKMQSSRGLSKEDFRLFVWAVDDTMWRLFCELDTDGNGYINLPEFRAGMLSMHWKMSDGDFKLFFDKHLRHGTAIGPPSSAVPVFSDDISEMFYPFPVNQSRHAGSPF